MLTGQGAVAVLGKLNDELVHTQTRTALDDIVSIYDAVF
jgi:hypothetical protein